MTSRQARRAPAMTADSVLPAVARAWLAAGRSVAAATLVGIDGPAPLEHGASMVVAADGQSDGSVTGGSIDDAVFEEAQAVLAGEPPRLVSYAISDDAAVRAGLTSGGTVHIVVAPIDEVSGEALLGAAAAVEAGAPAAVATLLDGPSAGSRLAILPGAVAGTLAAAERLDATVARDARGLLAQGITTVRRYGECGETLGSELRVHIRSYASAPQMLILGANDFSVAVARLARQLGYDVTICDARSAFASSPRFTAVAEVAVDWPDRHVERRTLTARDAVLLFTDDRRADEPALAAALRSGAGYVGALGSPRTHATRVARLLEAGVAQSDIDRIAAPCGLDVGARTPDETAVSVMAEVIARRFGRNGAALSTRKALRPADPTEARW
jgi:xanthine dehydrogenase accessory factor